MHVLPQQLPAPHSQLDLLFGTVQQNHSLLVYTGCHVFNLHGSSILSLQVWLWTTSTSVFTGQMLNSQ